MPTEKKQKLLCVDNIRHSEYYGMQEVFDELYAKSVKGDKFPNLMDIILCRENILLAYRNIKTNTGSNTAGTDRLTIKDIGSLRNCSSSSFLWRTGNTAAPCLSTYIS